MAAPHSTEENRYERRMAMVAMRKRGLSYGQIGAKFGVSSRSARAVIIRVMGKHGNAPKKQA